MAAQSDQSGNEKSSEIDIKEDGSQEDEPSPDKKEAKALKN